MKYKKPLKFFKDLIKNAKVKKPYQRLRVLGLHIREDYMSLAVSNPENTIALPLCILPRKENDINYLADKFRTLITEYNAMGFVVNNNYPTLVSPFVDQLKKTGKLPRAKYTYWEDSSILQQMDFVLKHHLRFIREQLNLPVDVSNEILQKFAATNVLQGYLNASNFVTEIDEKEDNKN
ncbi:hypothetical protein ACOSQ2_020481 [Xanthoceras sorbifolium]